MHLFYTTMLWLLGNLSTWVISLDTSSISPLTTKPHHACVVVLSGPDLCVHLHLIVLPAQLASYQQKRAKANNTGTSKKTQKRKGQAVSQVDSAPQGHHIEPAFGPAGDTEVNNKTGHEVYHRLWLPVNIRIRNRRWKKLEFKKKLSFGKSTIIIIIFIHHFIHYWMPSLGAFHGST